MRSADDAVERLAAVVEPVRNTPQGRFPIRWRQWQKHLAGTIGESVLADIEAAHPCGISREDLHLLANGTPSGASFELLRLFVATMMWGVGTGDNRGEWRVGQGLLTEGALDSIVATAGLVREGDIERAYQRLSRGPGRLNKVGESFFTKWLWISGVGQDLAPQPLILDDQVTASLLALRWRSDARGPLNHYLAYLEQSGQWASSLGVGPETIERALFDAGGEL